MRWSYTMLLTTGLLIVVDRLLGFIPTMYGFLGIPGQLSQYPAKLVYFLFYVSLLAFATSIYRRTTEADSKVSASRVTKARRNDPNLTAGVALSAFSSILFVIVLAAHKGDVPKQAIGWLLFVLIAGLLISSKSKLSLSTRTGLACIPAFAFFLYTLGFLILAFYVGGDFVISGPTERMTMEDVVKYGAIGFAVGIAAVPAIVAASLARDRVFELVSVTAKLSPDALTKLKGNVSLILGILAILAAAILGHGFTRE